MAEEKENPGLESAESKNLTVKEASLFTGISVSTLRRKIKNGALKAVLVKSRYGDEYLLNISDLEKIKKTTLSLPPPPPKPHTAKPTAVETAKAEKPETDQLLLLQEESKKIIEAEVFDLEKFRRNWQDLGRLMEERINEGQMQISELIYIFQEKERLLALKDSRIRNLTSEIKEQAEEIRSLRKRKGLLRQFAEYLRGLFVETE